MPYLLLQIEDVGVDGLTNFTLKLVRPPASARQPS